MPGELRAVLAEDQALLRVGLTRILETCGIRVVEAVDNAPALTRALGRDDPTSPWWTCGCRRRTRTRGCWPRSRRAARPGLPVLVLSQYVEPLYARDLLASGEGRWATC